MHVNKILRFDGEFLHLARLVTNSSICRAQKIELPGKASVICYEEDEMPKLWTACSESDRDP